MSIRIEAIASHTGMSGVFRLLSADLFEVLSVEEVEGFMTEPVDGEVDSLGPGAGDSALSELAGLQLVSQRINRAVDLAGLLSDALVALDEVFGFRHGMLLVPDESGGAPGHAGQPRLRRRGRGRRGARGRGAHRHGRRAAQAPARVRPVGRPALRAGHPRARDRGVRRRRADARRSRCPACPTRRASWPSRCWSAIASSACWRSRAGTARPSARGTRRFYKSWPTRSRSASSG